jgi:hypothetical protein
VTLFSEVLLYRSATQMCQFLPHLACKLFSTCKNIGHLAQSLLHLPVSWPQQEGAKIP